MHIREYQEWVEAWDKARGWDKVLPAHTLVHALEEMGEVARLVLAWEGYKQAEDRERVRQELAEELSDLFVFLFKLAYQVGIDVEEALRQGQSKADARFPDLAEAIAEGERYRQQLRANVARIHEVSDGDASSARC